VLLIGLAYLSAVYVLVPETRGDRDGSEAKRDRGLEAIEKRVCEHAEKIKRLRMTLVAKGPGEGTRTVARLLLDGDERFRFELTRGDDWHAAWIYDGTEGWHLQRSQYEVEFAQYENVDQVRYAVRRSRAVRGSFLEETALLYPYVAPEAFRDLFRNSSVRRVRWLRDDEFQGRPCRVVRIESRVLWWRIRTDLWLEPREPRVVKLESSTAYRPRLLGRWRKWQVVWKAVSVVSEFDTNPTFDDADFDVLPLLREFAEAVAHRTGELITTEEAFRRMPSGTPDGSGDADNDQEGDSRQEAPE
jgi:hypothetical protein